MLWRQLLDSRERVVGIGAVRVRFREMPRAPALAVSKGKGFPTLRLHENEVCARFDLHDLIVVALCRVDNDRFFGNVKGHGSPVSPFAVAKRSVERNEPAL